MLAGEQVDRRWPPAALLAAEHLKHVCERTITLLKQHANGDDDDTGRAGAGNLEPALGPVGQTVRDAEVGRVHRGRVDLPDQENKRGTTVEAIACVPMAGTSR